MQFSLVDLGLDHSFINITDIKADNIMFGTDDDSVFSDFENNDIQIPCPRKEVDVW